MPKKFDKGSQGTRSIARLDRELIRSIVDLDFTPTDED